MIHTKSKVKQVAHEGRKLLNYIARPYKSSSSADLSLWNYQDARLDLGVFSGNVPTLVINQDQKILDYNKAFELFFKEFVQQGNNLHISRWYEVLDNFRRLPKRTDNLYGEGLLPITDRNRIVFKSKKYGRCVFTKIMNPLIDRKTAKILGWSIVLNINSISKRQQYFEDLDVSLKHEVAHLRYVTTFDNVIQSHRDFQEILHLHTSIAQPNTAILDLSAHTGEVGLRLAAAGAKVSILDSDIEFLRTVKAKLSRHLNKPKLVLRKKEKVYQLPMNRFDHISIAHGIKDKADLREVFSNIYNALKENGTVSYSALSPSVLESQQDHTLYNYFKNELKARGEFDVVKYQVDSSASQYIQHARASSVALDELIKAAKTAGFQVEMQRISGWFYFLKLRK